MRTIATHLAAACLALATSGAAQTSAPTPQSPLRPAPSFAEELRGDAAGSCTSDAQCGPGRRCIRVDDCQRHCQVIF